MTTKISELRARASEWALQYDPDTIGDSAWEKLWDEKFAELIVSECANFVDSAISDGGVDGHSVKKHFGIVTKLQEPSWSECNDLVISLAGSHLLAEHWWGSANQAFEGETPNRMFDLNPVRVYQYLLSVSEGVW